MGLSENLKPSWSKTQLSHSFPMFSWPKHAFWHAIWHDLERPGAIAIVSFKAVDQLGRSEILSFATGGLFGYRFTHWDLLKKGASS